MSCRRYCAENCSQAADAGQDRIKQRQGSLPGGSPVQCAAQGAEANKVRPPCAFKESRFHDLQARLPDHGISYQGAPDLGFIGAFHFHNVLFLGLRQRELRKMEDQEKTQVPKPLSALQARSRCFAKRSSAFGRVHQLPDPSFRHLCNCW